jgi:chemotaxis protein methyltransferase CheR
MGDATISTDDYQKFREYFYRKTGIHFEDGKRYFVDKRLAQRIAVNGCADFRSYFTMLRFEPGGKELQALVNLMTVNETYFFREEYQFDCLVNSMLPEIVRNKTDDGPIRIWIIPSSSGEEAYSIAICLLERWPALARWNVELISSDIDTRILGQAREGLYTARSVQHVPSAYLAKYFERNAHGYQLCADVRDSVAFSRVNLMEAADVRGYRSMDVIFCRNLLIYFDDVSRKQAAETFFDALRPGGFICLGHSESMSRISSMYQIRKFPEAIVYQKPGGAR